MGVDADADVDVAVVAAGAVVAVAVRVCIPLTCAVRLLRPVTRLNGDVVADGRRCGVMTLLSLSMYTCARGCGCSGCLETEMRVAGVCDADVDVGVCDDHACVFTCVAITLSRGDASGLMVFLLLIRMRVGVVAAAAVGVSRRKGG